ncbi:MAG: 2-enoyl thioester reductase domain-containing protein [Opitutales bacterium]|nr:2-enoyl thioester reductase domain-containing protein [Opitutales bacterium]
MKDSLAVTYHEHGPPAETLRVETVPLPEVGPGKVLIKMLAAVIHPSDFGMISGTYGRLAELPAVAGREGVGEIVETGEGVEALKPGDWVRMPEDGAWRAYAVAEGEKLMKAPNTIPVELAAMAFINPPTAWRILRDAHLSPGDWLIQNAANSAVGYFVIQMARALDIRTVNVVRREELVQPLKDLGADVVVLEDSGYEKRVKELTGGQPVVLGLNSVGGESALRLIKSLGDGGTMVTFGAMDFTPIRFPTRQLIFNNITLSGFWLDRWYRENSRERVKVMQDRLYNLMTEGKVSAPVAETFPLERVLEAVEAAGRPRLGKVLLTPA